MPSEDDSMDHGLRLVANAQDKPVHAGLGDQFNAGGSSVQINATDSGVQYVASGTRSSLTINNSGIFLGSRAFAATTGLEAFINHAVKVPMAESGRIHPCVQPGQSFTLSETLCDNLSPRFSHEWESECHRLPIPLHTDGFWLTPPFQAWISAQNSSLLYLATPPTVCSGLSHFLLKLLRLLRNQDIPILSAFNPLLANETASTSEVTPKELIQSLVARIPEICVSEKLSGHVSAPEQCALQRRVDSSSSLQHWVEVLATVIARERIPLIFIVVDMTMLSSVSVDEQNGTVYIDLIKELMRFCNLMRESHSRSTVKVLVRGLTGVMPEEETIFNEVEGSFILVQTAQAGRLGQKLLVPGIERSLLAGLTLQKQSRVQAQAAGDSQ